MTDHCVVRMSRAHATSAPALRALVMPSCRRAARGLWPQAWSAATSTGSLCAPPPAVVLAVPYAYRLIEALAFGVVPVVVADEYVLPFSEVLQWDQFSVRWPYARLSSLVGYLRTLDEVLVCKMRRRAREVYLKYFATPAAQVDTTLRILASRWR